jgi:hypothetical protein
MANTFELISAVTVGGAGAASIDFTSIPSTFTDICVVYSLRSNRAASQEDGKLTFNGTSTNYSGKVLQGNGASASSYSSSTSYIENLVMPAATATATTFSNGTIYVPNYTASAAKSVSIDSVTENNATTAFTSLIAGLWNNTAVITSLSIAPNQGGSFVQYSTAYLYGVKNA